MWGKAAPTLSRCPTILFDRRVSAREDSGRNFPGAIGVFGCVRTGVWNPRCRDHARVLKFRLAFEWSGFDLDPGSRGRDVGEQMCRRSGAAGIF